MFSGNTIYLIAKYFLAITWAIAKTINIRARPLLSVIHRSVQCIKVFNLKVFMSCETVCGERSPGTPWGWGRWSPERGRERPLYHRAEPSASGPPWSSSPCTSTGRKRCRVGVGFLCSARPSEGCSWSVSCMPRSCDVTAPPRRGLGYRWAGYRASGTGHTCCPQDDFYCTHLLRPGHKDFVWDHMLARNLKKMKFKILF